MDNQQLSELYDSYGTVSEKQWKNFVYYALLVSGAGFLISGIVFFFAFNWDHMPKTVKFSLIGVGLLLSVYFSLTNRVKEGIQKISLLASTVLVGVLMAVFGQTYQTGANAYDLFLTWLVVITPLTLLSKFTYQWLFYSILANTTVILALVQLLQVDSIFMGILYLLGTNLLLFILPQLKLVSADFQLGQFYKQIQLIAVYLLATTGVGVWLFTNLQRYNATEIQGATWALVSAILVLVAGLGIGWKQKQIYLFSYAFIASISCGLMLLMKLFEDGAEGLLVYMLYSIGAIFLIIKVVSMKSKAWKHEE